MQKNADLSDTQLGTAELNSPLIIFIFEEVSKLEHFEPIQGHFYSHYNFIKEMSNLFCCKYVYFRLRFVALLWS